MNEFRLTAEDLEEQPIVEGEVVTPNGASALPAVRQSAMMQVRTRYTTAMAVVEPRSIQKIEKRLMQEAALLGEDAFYSWEVSSQDQKTGDSKKELIQGPSIGLALVAARVWGNCVTDQDDVVETPEAWFYNAKFIDLETGFTTVRTYRQSRRHRVFGRMDEERKETIRYEIGQSKAIRNVIINALPRWLINHALEEAKDGVLRGLKKYINAHSIEAAREIILKRLAGYKVTVPMVLEKLERETIQAITVEDLVILQGDAKALENGEETIGSLFGDGRPTPSEAGKPEGQPAQSRTAEAKEQVRQRRQSTPKPAAETSPYATKEQTDELSTLAEACGATEDLNKLFAHTEPDKVTTKQYEDTKAYLLKRWEESGQKGATSSPAAGEGPQEPVREEQVKSPETQDKTGILE